MGDPMIFIFLAAIAVVAAILMVTSRNAVHSALFLVANFVAIAVLYVTLNAPFIAMVQVTVYAGAIMVLFLFVIMLLGAEKLLGVSSDAKWQRWLALLLALLLVAGFLTVLLQEDGAGATASGAFDSGPANLGLRLFEGYVFPFELTGILLLVAMIGIVALSRPKKRGEDA
jgi:NADH-quinone oxidoreductase subunit J